MQKLLMVLTAVAIVFLLFIMIVVAIMLFAPPIWAEETSWEIKLGDTTYLIQKVEEGEKMPQRLNLSLLSDDIAVAIRQNPVSLPQYIGAQLNFLSEIIVKILETGKPVAIFETSKTGWIGAEVTVWDRGEVSWVAGIAKTNEQENEEEQTTDWFFGMEKRGIPWARDIWKIFDRFDIGVVMLRGNVYASIAYEFKTEE